MDCIISGYRIMAIMSPFQGDDTGSNPVTRSNYLRIWFRYAIWKSGFQK